MGVISGLIYNIRGLAMALRSGKLFFWGIVRFVFVLLITILSAGLILVFHQDIMGALWTRPESIWVVWLWHLLSWALSLALVALSALFSFLLSQILFSVLVMDLMSRHTERMLSGRVIEGESMSIPRLFLFLVKQEIPRTIIPVGISLLLALLGWFTPLGPVVVPLSSAAAAIFLAWDNTDLTPGRRGLVFKERFKVLLKSLPFHLGFGLPFLIPGLNLIFLAFAPVGGTLYSLRELDGLEHAAFPKRRSG
ncbi:MAG: EI24 domain-containing protein [Desulfobacteraceae bacterium]